VVIAGTPLKWLPAGYLPALDVFMPPGFAGMLLTSLPAKINKYPARVVFIPVDPMVSSFYVIPVQKAQDSFFQLSCSFAADYLQFPGFFLSGFLEGVFQGNIDLATLVEYRVQIKAKASAGHVIAPHALVDLTVFVASHDTDMCPSGPGLRRICQRL